MKKIGLFVLDVTAGILFGMLIALFIFGKG